MKESSLSLLLALFLSIGLAACGGAEVETEPPQTVVPSSTQVPIPSSTAAEPSTATPLPAASRAPTETPLPPTAVPASSTPLPPTATTAAEPAETLPEFMVNEQEDVVGEWTRSEGHGLILASNGGLKSLYEGRLYTPGTYYFEADQMVIESDFCETWEADNVTVFPCTAAYTVYAIKDGDTVVMLRFEPLEDPYTNRRLAMKGSTWQRVEE